MIPREQRAVFCIFSCVKFIENFGEKFLKKKNFGSGVKRNASSWGLAYLCSGVEKRRGEASSWGLAYLCSGVEKRRGEPFLLWLACPCSGVKWGIMLAVVVVFVFLA